MAGQLAVLAAVALEALETFEAPFRLALPQRPAVAIDQARQPAHRTRFRQQHEGRRLPGHLGKQPAGRLFGDDRLGRRRLRCAMPGRIGVTLHRIEGIKAFKRGNAVVVQPHGALPVLVWPH
ncbi:hypothetical protein [Roseateles sp. P5_E4]